MLTISLVLCILRYLKWKVITVLKFAEVFVSLLCLFPFQAKQIYQNQFFLHIILQLF